MGKGEGEVEEEERREESQLFDPENLPHKQTRADTDRSDEHQQSINVYIVCVLKTAMRM